MAVSNTSASVIQQVTNISSDLQTSNNLTVETTTLVNNIVTTALTYLANGNASITPDAGYSSNATNILQQPMLPEDGDGTHKNPELKYFSTVIIIFMGLTILIVPVFCFVGVVCARARIFKTVREAAGRGWGFGDLNVPYAEFGTAEDYAKPDNIDAPTAATSNSGSSSSSTHCDVNILVADDNRVPSIKNVRRGSFLRAHHADDEDEDISSLPPTFVHHPA